jgi:hypothetical protein
MLSEGFSADISYSTGYERGNGLMHNNNNRKIYSQRLMRSVAAVFFVGSAFGVAQAQTATPTPAPAQAQPEGAGHGGMDHGAMGHGGMGGMGMGHDGGMGGMDHGAMGGMDHGGGMMKQMMCGFTEHLDARLAYLKTELKITDQQAPQWNAFADSWRAVAQKASAKCAALDEHQMDGKQGVLGKLSMMETHMTDHLEVIRAQKTALEPFYNVLTEDQKKAANETLTRVMKVGMSMHGGGMGGMQHDSGGMGHGGMDHSGMGGMNHGGMGMGGMGHGGMGQGGGMGSMQH